MLARSGRAEWRGQWMIPIAGMIGISGGSIFVYSGGVLMPEMTRALGWSRAEYSTGFLASVLVGMIAMPVVGRVVDRVGARPIALLGSCVFPIVFSLFGLVSGVLVGWWLLCFVAGLFEALKSPPVWLSGVASRFDASRGLALAVTLCGNGLGAAVWPVLATHYVALVGWRLSFALLGLSWLVVSVPLTLLFFRPARVIAADRPASPSRSEYRTVLRLPGFWLLALSGSLFTLAVTSITLHLVPMLRDNGITPVAAASVAGMLGLAAMVGRLCCGVLLDRLPAKLVGPVAFLLPLIGILILLVKSGSFGLAAVAGVLIGLGAGAEYDIVAYVLSRNYGVRLFSGLLGIVYSVIAVSAGIGPIIAGKVYDTTGTYTIFLLATLPMLVAGAVIIRLSPVAKHARPQALD